MHDDDIDRRVPARFMKMETSVAGSENPVPQSELRDAAEVMAPRRAGAACAGALSFSRSAMNELVRRRARVERLRTNLDADGRGEVLYKLACAGRTFHFFVISNQVAESQKIDRNVGANWDAMAVLCQGPWTTEREAYFRREIPKQRSGRADYDTLVCIRGNRSGRLFERVVESLAAGRQPDLRQLAQVGYILRTTAFIGNGQLGTLPLDGYDSDHPLRQPYHAQICAAFMLREYVFDLVDHMARSRNKEAVRLAPAYRRYLGIGNSAATGLIPFIVNHPHIIHRWTLTYETALAQAKSRDIGPESPQLICFMTLLEKAARYFAEDRRDGGGIFMPTASIAGELQTASAIMHKAMASSSTGSPRLSWEWFIRWAREALDSETVEVLNALILESYPDIVETHSRAFKAEEAFRLDSAMSAGTLKALLSKNYGWALDGHDSEAADHYFWYRSKAAPLDVRRGIRGRLPAVEFETAMDVWRMARQLNKHLATVDDADLVADILHTWPELRFIVERIQSLAGCRYSELRENYLARDFNPFAPIRFVLSFYGMEKFEAATPKSVRGALLQGAPIAEDVAAGRDGTWPFPLVPDHDDHALRNAPNRPVVVTEGRSEAGDRPDPEPAQILVAPSEIERAMLKATEAAGLPLGLASEVAQSVAFAEAFRANGLELAFAQYDNMERFAGVRLLPTGPNSRRLDAARAPALAAGLLALEQAGALAARRGFGTCIVAQATGVPSMEFLALRAARRGLSCLVWGRAGPGEAALSSSFSECVAAAGQEEAGSWLFSGLRSGRDSAWTDSVGSLSSGTGFGSDLANRVWAAAAKETTPDSDGIAEWQTARGCDFLVLCLRPDAAAAERNSLNQLYFTNGKTCGRNLFEVGEIDRIFERAVCKGLPVNRAAFARLNDMAASLFVSPTDEHRLRQVGYDPLRTF